MNKTRRGFLKLMGKAAVVAGVVAAKPELAFTKSASCEPDALTKAIRETCNDFDGALEDFSASHRVNELKTSVHWVEHYRIMKA